MDSRTLGILGGGQLGRMMVEAANRLNIKTVILDAENSPAKQINAVGSHVNGSFTDEQTILELASKSDVITVEIEHVDASVLEKLQASGKTVHPSPQTIRLIQDKYLQKKHFIKHSIPTSESYDVESDKKSLADIGEKLGYPFMLKSRTNSYDGRGNFLVKTVEQIEEALKFLADRPLYAEKFADFERELAVMVVRSINGDVFSYPVVETVHQNNICHLVYAPAEVPDSVHLKTRKIAEEAVSTLTGAGIFGVEMFHLRNGEIWLNEIAPRPHNSGHYTQDACVTSQFEAHIRAVMGLPLPKGFSDFSTPSTKAIMLNILGTEKPDGELDICKRSMTIPGTILHLYGKSTRKGRKVGHINIISGSMVTAKARLADILGENTKKSMVDISSEQPLVGIIMGSDSDLPVMRLAGDILANFNVPFELTIVSAHRTPYRMTQYATQASNRGLKAIIAGAGGAAHLPGMVAAMTSLPVIGVPVKGSTLDGVDSLHSIVQMPRGVPVATVAINNATNAALLAIRILSSFMPEYQTKLEKYMSDMEKEVLKKAGKLEAVGYEKYTN